MKTLLGFAVATLIAVGSFTVVAEMTATPEDQAKATCTEKKLEGALFDECVKNELAKVTAKKAPTPAAAPTTQPTTEQPKTN